MNNGLIKISGTTTTLFKNEFQGLSWWSSDEDTVLPLKGTCVRSLVRQGTRSHMPYCTAKKKKKELQDSIDFCFNKKIQNFFQYSFPVLMTQK